MSDAINGTIQSLDTLSNSTKSYADLFNSANKAIASGVYASNRSIVELGDELSKLSDEASDLKTSLANAISINDTVEIDKLVKKYQDLEYTFSNLGETLEEGLDSLNRALAQEFDTSSVDSIKTKLNSAVNDLGKFKKQYGVTLDSINPEFEMFQMQLKGQNDRITYSMGLLSRYKSTRSALELSTGFTISEFDIGDAVKEKEDEIKDLQDTIDSLVGDGTQIFNTADKEYIDGLKKQIKDLETYIKSLKSSVGKHTDGYIDLYNQTENAAKAVDVKMPLINHLGNKASEVVSTPELTDEIEKIDTLNQQIKAIHKAKNDKLDDADKDTIKQLKERIAESEATIKIIEDSVVSRMDPKDIAMTPSQYNNNNKQSTLDLGDSWDNQDILEAPKVNNIDNLNTEKKVSKDINEILNEKQDIINNISDELKEQYLSDTKIEEATKRGLSNISTYQSGLNAIGRTRVEQSKSPIKIDSSNINQVAIVTSYKNNAEDALLKAKQLQTELLKNAEIASDISRTSILSGGVTIDTNALDDVQSILSSPYRINLDVNSAEFKQLEEAEIILKSVVQQYADLRVAMPETGDESKLGKYLALREMELKLNNKEDAEKNRDRTDKEYIASQRTILANEKAIAAFKYMHNSEMAKAKTAPERKAIDLKYNAKEVKDINGKVTQPSGLIEMRESQIRLAKARQSFITRTYGENGLTLPEVSTKNIKPAMGEYYKPYLDSKRADLDAYRNNMQAQDKVIKEILGNKKQGTNTSQLETKLKTLKDNMDLAFRTKNTERLMQLTPEYIALIDKLKNKIEGAAKAQSIASKRQEDNLKKEFNATKSYVSNQEAETKKPMDYKDQIDYYTKQLPKFVKNSEGYYSVLKLLNAAETAQSDAAKAAADKDIKAKLAITKAYIAQTEGLSKGTISYADRANYYSKQLKLFIKDSKEYTEVLMLQKEAEKAAEDEKESDIKNKTKQDFDETKAYVSTQEANTKQPMSHQAKIDYYTKQLPLFIKNSKEWIEVLKLLNAAESAKDTATKKTASDKIKDEFDTTKSYVANEEARTNKPMSYKDQIDYYTKQLPKFVVESEEYIAILKLKNAAEKNQANESKSAAEKNRATLKNIGTGITSTITKITSTIRSAFQNINQFVSGAVRAFQNVGNAIRQVVTFATGFGNRIKQAFGLATTGANGANKGFNILKGTATELRSKLLLLSGALERVFNNQLLIKGNKLYSSVYTLKTIMGDELTNDTIAWANKMEYAFGLSAKNLLTDLSRLSTIMYGLGMAKADVSVASKNFAILARHYALMGHYGGSIEEVTTAIISGLKGETEAIDNLGLSIKAAQMNQYLRDLKAQGGEYSKLGNRIEDLTEQQRVYVRYAAIMEQYTSKYDVTAFAASLDTVTGRITILKEASSSFGVTLGQVFTRLLSSVAPTLTYIVKFIESKISGLAVFLGSILGTDLTIGVSADMNNSNKATDGLNKNLGKTEEELKAIDDAAAKAGESMKNASVAGFDQLESVDTKSDKAGAGAGAGGIDYSFLMSDKLGELNALADAATVSYYEKQKERFEASLAERKSTFINWIKDITGRATIDLGFNWPSIKQKLGGILGGIKLTLGNVGALVISIGIKVLDDINIGTLIDNVLKVIASIVNLAETISSKLMPEVNKFYDKFISPLVTERGKKISDTLLAISSAINDISTNISLSGAPDLVKKFEEFKKAHPVLQTIIDIFTKIKEIGNTLIKEVLPPILASFGEFLKSEFLPWLLGKLNELGEWLKEHKDKIKTLLETVGNFAWDTFKLFVEAVAKLIDYIVEHPKSVQNFFIALLALNVAGWFIGAANGVLGMITNLKTLGLMKAPKALAEVGAEAATKTGILSKVGGGLAKAGGAVAKGATAAAGGIGSFVSGSGILTGAGATTASGIAMAGASAALGLFLVGKDAVQGMDKSTDIFGTQEGNTTSAKVSTGIGFGLGGQAGAFDAAKTAGEKAGSIALNALKGAALGAALGSVVPGLGTAVGALVGGVVGTVTGVIGGENISKVVNGAWEGLKTGATGAWNTVSSTASNAWAAVKSKGSEAVTGAKESITNLGASVVEKFDSMKGKASDLWTKVKESEPWNIAKGAATILKNSAVQDFNLVKDTVSGLWTSVKDGTAWDTITKAATTLKNSAVQDFNLVKDSVSNLWDKVKDKSVWEVGGMAVDGIVKSFSGLKARLSPIWSDVKSGATSVLAGIGTTLTDIWKGIKNGITNAGNYLTGKTTQEPTFTVPNVPYVRPRATGGHSMTGQMFIANENGAELVGNIGGGIGADVANNSMIIKAIEEASYRGQVRANAANKNNRGSGEIHLHMNENGITIMDENQLRKLEQTLSKFRGANMSNIANVEFSL